MKKAIFLLLCSLCSFALQAQPLGTTVQTSSGAPTSLDAERARIKSARERLESTFEAENAACYRKLLVNNCLGDVKTRRREALADLRRQEISVNEQERRAKGAEQLRRAEEKASPERQQQAADRRAAAAKELEYRLEREKQKKSGRTAPESRDKTGSDAVTDRMTGRQKKVIDRADRQAARAEEIRKFNERQIKAKERQQKHDRELLDQSKPRAKPLPMPE